jgi:Type IV secretion-system coupling protein DNA-binding domain
VADTIAENCGNTLILSCSASEHGGTAEFSSKLIGQHQVTHTTRSISRRSGEWRKSTTLSEQVNIEPAVMASEIERLPDLDGFLKFASIPDWHRVELVPLSSPSCARNKPAPTAEAMPSAANTPTRADTPTSPAAAAQSVADTPPAAQTVAPTLTPTNTSPSPPAAPTVIAPCGGNIPYDQNVTNAAVTTLVRALLSALRHSLSVAYVSTVVLRRQNYDLGFNPRLP